MKILIVNTSDIDGGAARAAYRLHKALLTNWSLGIASSKKESKKLEELENRSLLIKKSFFERVVNKLKIILKGKK